MTGLITSVITSFELIASVIKYHISYCIAMLWDDLIEDNRMTFISNNTSLKILLTPPTLLSHKCKHSQQAYQQVCL